MPKYKIAWLPGDGVGNDVMEAARIVLDALQLDAEYIHGDIGWEFWKSEGNPLPERTINLLNSTDCCLFGAITSKPKGEAQKELSSGLQGKGYVYSSPIVDLRQLLKLHTNMRPCKAFPGNPLNYRDDIDLVVFRENTEGLYAGIEFRPVEYKMRKELERYNKKMEKFQDIEPEDMAITLRVITRQASETIVRDAFEYAEKFGKPSVTVVEKPNVLRESSGLFVEVARGIARDHPDIELWETNIDAMCMWLVKNPQDYSVIVTSNLFGDIISDLCAQLVGGLGFASAANIGDDYAISEPTHGSAPKYSGQYKVNPSAMILAVKLMLEHLGETGMAQKVQSGLAETIKEGKVRTYDMGGSSSTLEMARAVVKNME